MKNYLSFLLILFYSCSKSQTVSQYTTTYVNSTLDTVTVLLTVTATTRIDTATVINTRWYHKPPPPVTGSFVLDTIPFSDVDLIAPFRAAGTFYTWTQTQPIPDAANGWAFDNETRFNWGDLQTGLGVYTWGNLDNQLNTSIDRGQKFRFRVITIATSNAGAVSVGGAMCGYPIFVHSAMQNETVKDWVPSGSGMWVPNWNSPSYLSNWEVFLLALANHINSGVYKGISYKNVVSSFDICGFGNYGEWHNAGSGRGIEPAGTKATGTSLIRIVQANITAFPNIPLIGNVDMFYDENDAQLGNFVLTTANNWGKIGFRNDHLGDHNTWVSEVTNTRNYNGFYFYPEYLKRWLYAPMVGEPINYTSAASAGGNCNFWDMENEIRQLHASQFNNQNGTGITTGCVQTNYLNSSKACGYRLSITGGSISGNSLTLNWSNSGIASIYENWDVYLIANGTQIKTAESLKFKMGKWSSTYTLPSGNYSVYVIIKDPNGYRKSFPLYNKNRLSDGSYLITNVSIL